MWGVVTWIVAGTAVWALARLVRRGRAGMLLELAAAVAAALVAGFAATALDFGGIAVLDLRAVAFAFLAAAAAVAAVRLRVSP